MTKVLRIINRYNLGGPVYNAAYLSAHLNNGFETMLIGGDHEENEGDAKYIIESQGVYPVVIENMQRSVNPLKDKAALKEIRSIIKKYKPDIVHTHASKAGALGRKAAIKEKVPIIVHTFHGHVFHGYFGSLKTALFKKIERSLAKKTDAIIAISNIQKEELSKVHGIAEADKFRVIPLGFDLKRFTENKSTKKERFRLKHQVNKEAIVLGIIGRLVPIKNHELLFESLAITVTKTAKPIELLVIGDGELRTELESKAIAIEKNVKGLKIKFLGWERNIENALPAMDIVCMSSLNEGTPVSLIEAQAAGIPVISTNVGGVRDVVQEGETGLIVDSFTPDDYAEVLTRLVKDEDLRRNMSQNGWRFVEERFSYKRLCRDMMNLYNELLIEKGLK